MKFITSVILTALVAFAACLYFPWWSIAITSFIVAIAVHQKPLKAFTAGFAGLFLLWGIQAYIIDAANEHLISSKIASLITGSSSYMLIIVISALVGGLVAAFAALAGSFARKIKS